MLKLLAFIPRSCFLWLHTFYAFYAFCAFCAFCGFMPFVPFVLFVPFVAFMPLNGLMPVVPRLKSQLVSHDANTCSITSSMGGS